ncbi:MAG: transketolase C-terminal domain-containing protein [Thermodesulfobacteriota bacterium]
MGKATRAAFGEALKKLGERMPEVVALDADLAGSTNTHLFAQQFPERFFQLGIAEGNMVSVAAGLALAGKIPFAASFACFLTGRFEQIRVSVAYNRANVKLVGTHAGVGIGEDGYSQMGLEDVALMRSLPNMLVLQPADALEAEQAVEAAARHVGPVYLRVTRQKLDDVHASGYRFELGKLDPLRDGEQVTILATGGVVANALAAAAELAKQGISAGVVNVHTLQPIDQEGLLALAARCRQLVTVEDHGIVGGLGSAVCEALAETTGVRIRRIAVRTFGESGTGEALYEKHGLHAAGIAAAVAEFVRSGAPSRASA